jgi:hypothetical protein
VTALISAVIGLVEGKPLVQVGRACCECTFPYFMSGIVFAGLVSSAFPRSTVWNGAVALFPIRCSRLSVFADPNENRCACPNPARFHGSRRVSGGWLVRASALNQYLIFRRCVYDLAAELSPARLAGLGTLHLWLPFVTGEVASSSLVVLAILSKELSDVTPKTPTHNPTHRF